MKAKLNLELALLPGMFAHTRNLWQKLHSATEWQWQDKTQIIKIIIYKMHIVYFVYCVCAILHIVYFVYLYIIIFIICVLSCHCYSVALWSFCHQNKFLVCANIPGNKANSDSDSEFSVAITPVFSVK